MAICTEQLPFSLSFEQTSRMHFISSFYQHEEDVPESEYVTIRENMDLKIIFASDQPDARLYMDGLEGTTNEVDERGDLFLRPSAESRLIYQHGEFPLIPGDYLLRILCGTSFYCTIMRIIPKQITTEQLELMKQEINTFMEGLGRERVSVRAGSLTGALPPLLEAKLQFVQKHVKSLLPAVADLRDRAAYRLRKEYSLMPLEQARRVDEVTIRHYLKHPERREAVKAPLYQVDYDVPENRWLKRVVRGLEKSLQEMEEELKHLKMDRGKEVSGKMAVPLQQLQKSLRLLQSASWFEQVDASQQADVPHSIHSDARYRSILQLHRELGRVQGTEAKCAEMRWKRTDKLYEIWGFIQFLQVLLHKLQFSPRSGWVFSEQQSLAALTPNTKIELEKGDLQLQLYYEGEIPLDYRQEAPLYMEGSNNRPDMRLDVFQNEVYIGSLLFDFKYRPLHHIWDVRKVRNKISVMRQLTNYAMLCRSCSLYGGAAHARFVRPVHEVWAIHPNRFTNYPDSQKYELHDIRIMRLTPDDEHEHIAEALRTAFMDMQNKFQIFSQ